MKSTLIYPLLALASSVLAVPPACLLNAVNGQQDPSNLGAVCGKEATSVQQAIASLCGNNASAAQSAFIATCSGAGSSVAPYTAKSTKSSSGSSSGSSGSKSTSSGTFVYTTAVYNSDCSCSTTIVTSATGAAAASSLGLTTATATGSGTAAATSASQTGNVANDFRGMGSFAAAAVAMAGVVAAL